ncbi:helix-turn-helix domain-containing protein [Paenibacillus sp. MSJ-34]|uniref:helix-turn-helix domain-containing protein n=1 Tax=Paenibacillus sp. MSJ-34 TaxID=2841529 RepID=UPI00345F2A6F
MLAAFQLTMSNNHGLIYNLSPKLPIYLHKGIVLLWRITVVDIRLEFGQRCKELRARSGMSQEMLAYRSGLDRSYISGVERGDRNISINQY